MSEEIYNEDAEVRVGVVVRPLRGHWRPAKDDVQSQPDTTPVGLDRSVWKTTSGDYDNIANLQFVSKMVNGSPIAVANIRSPFKEGIDFKSKVHVCISATSKDASFEVQPRFGRPIAFNDEASRSAFEEQPNATSSSAMFGCDQKTIVSHLHTIGYSNDYCEEYGGTIVYSNHRLHGTDSGSLDSNISQGTTPSSTTDDDIVKPCPKSCACHRFDGKKSPPPEENRIPLPPDLEAEEKARQAKKAENGKPPEMKASAKQQQPGVSTAKEFRSKEKAALSKDDSSDEIRVTSRPLPPPPKPLPKPKPKKSVTRASSQKLGANGEKSTPTSSDKVSAGRRSRAPSKERTGRDSDRQKARFSTVEPVKSGPHSPSGFTTDSSTSGQKASVSSGSSGKPAEGIRQGQKLSSRPHQTLSRSRLKTVTYKEEAFLSESKSWILLLIFIFIIWLYRSTLS